MGRSVLPDSGSPEGKTEHKTHCQGDNGRNSGEGYPTPPHPTKAPPQLSACVCKRRWTLLPHPTPPNQSPTPAQCVCLQANMNVIAPPHPTPPTLARAHVRLKKGGCLRVRTWAKKRVRRWGPDPEFAFNLRCVNQGSSGWDLAHKDSGPQRFKAAEKILTQIFLMPSRWSLLDEVSSQSIGSRTLALSSVWHFATDRPLRMLMLSGAGEVIPKAARNLRCQMCHAWCNLLGMHPTSPTTVPTISTREFLETRFLCGTARGRSIQCGSVVDSFLGRAHRLPCGRLHIECGFYICCRSSCMGSLVRRSLPAWSSPVEVLNEPMGVIHDTLYNHVPDEATWRLGRAERHGAILKLMLLKMLKSLNRTATTAACSAKNRLCNHGGIWISPRRIVRNVFVVQNGCVREPSKAFIGWTPAQLCAELWASSRLPLTLSFWSRAARCTSMILLPFAVASLQACKTTSAGMVPRRWRASRRTSDFQVECGCGWDIEWRQYRWRRSGLQQMRNWWVATVSTRERTSCTKSWRLDASVPQRWMMSRWPWKMLPGPKPIFPKFLLHHLTLLRLRTKMWRRSWDWMHGWRGGCLRMCPCSSSTHPRQRERLRKRMWLKDLRIIFRSPQTCRPRRSRSSSRTWPRPYKAPPTTLQEARVCDQLEEGLMNSSSWLVRRFEPTDPPKATSRDVIRHYIGSSWSWRRWWCDHDCGKGTGTGSYLSERDWVTVRGRDWGVGRVSLGEPRSCRSFSTRFPEGWEPPCLLLEPALVLRGGDAWVWAGPKHRIWPRSKWHACDRGSSTTCALVGHCNAVGAGAAEITSRAAGGGGDQHAAICGVCQYWKTNIIVSGYPCCLQLALTVGWWRPRKTAINVMFTVSKSFLDLCHPRWPTTWRTGSNGLTSVVATILAHTALRRWCWLIFSKSLHSISWSCYRPIESVGMDGKVCRFSGPQNGIGCPHHQGLYNTFWALHSEGSSTTSS